MATVEKQTFSLENFEGPLDLLLHLINNDEVDACEVVVDDIVKQYLARIHGSKEHNVEAGGLFLSLVTWLLVIKSRRLLPREERSILDDDVIDDDGDVFSLTEHLLDYYRFKKAAKDLSEKEDERSGIFYRPPTEAPSVRRRTGVEHLSLDDIVDVFHEVLQRCPRPLAENRYHEEWTVADKIPAIQHLIAEEIRVQLSTVLSDTMCREEIITAFLAILEMMKNGEVYLSGDVSSIETIYVTTTKEPS